MELLLALVGAAVAFVAGWMFRRSGEPLVDLDDTAEPSLSLPSLAGVLEHHPTGVTVADSSSNIVFRNAAARSIRGTHVGVLIDEAIERHLGAAQAGAVVSEELELYGPPRTVVSVHARPLDDGGAVAFVQDVSDQRRTDQVRTDFVANVSHELKTPIGAMSVLAETMLDETDVDTIHRVVDRMMAEADRAIRFVDDLMELSRIELGGERVVEPIRVSEIVRGGVDRVAELAKSCGIGVRVVEPVDVGGACSGGPVVSGDRRQLVSAVGNLVENAVKYSPSGSTVTVRTRVDADAVEIVVTDEGVGIPQRDLDRIFERFYRVDRARSRSTGGTGLGLSIVRHVANNHDGTVLVESTEGEGSTFVLRLPVPADRSTTHNGHSEGAA
jgi:two-component system sensor histidine kinase SenX3